jgi:hypothetical protein
MRTTLTIDDDVAVRLERLRAERRAGLKAVVNEVLRAGLDATEAARRGGDDDRAPYRIRPEQLGAPRLPNLDDVAEVLAFAEGEEWR